MSSNVCFFVGNLNLAGGTERATTLIANAFVARHLNVFVLNVHGGDQPFFPLSQHVQRHALFSHKVSMKTHALTAIWKIRQFVKQHHIDHFIVVDSISYVFACPALLGLNVQHICWEHFSFDVDLGHRFRRLGRLLAAKYSHTIVTLTKHDAMQWQAHISSMNAQIVSIPNTLSFPIQSSEPTQAHKTVLSVGRLRPEKGFDILIEAWTYVQTQYPDWQLVIVGSGDHQTQLIQHIQDLNLSDTVHIHPATQDLTPYYQTASIYALSSRSEGFGMVLLEAMAFGLPIVATQCIGPQEILQSTHNILVKADHVTQFADGLMEAITWSKDVYQQQINENKLHVMHYLPEHIVNQWLKVLNIESTP